MKTLRVFGRPTAAVLAGGFLLAGAAPASADPLPQGRSAWEVEAASKKDTGGILQFRRNGNRVKAVGWVTVEGKPWEGGFCGRGTIRGNTLRLTDQWYPGSMTFRMKVRVQDFAVLRARTVWSESPAPAKWQTYERVSFRKGLSKDC